MSHFQNGFSPKKWKPIRAIRRVGPFVGRGYVDADPTPSKNFLESTANESRLGAFDGKLNDANGLARQPCLRGFAWNGIYGKSHEICECYQ